MLCSIDKSRRIALKAMLKFAFVVVVLFTTIIFLQQFFFPASIAANIAEKEETYNDVYSNIMMRLSSQWKNKISS